MHPHIREDAVLRLSAVSNNYIVRALSLCTRGWSVRAKLQQQTRTLVVVDAPMCGWLGTNDAQRRALRHFASRTLKYGLVGQFNSACLCHVSRTRRLSFSLIRDRSAGFMIGCNACNRRLALCSGH